MADQKMDIESIKDSVYGASCTRLGLKNHSIAITIVNPAATQTDTVTINGVAIPFASDANPTVAEVAAGLRDAINASTDPKVQGKVLASVDGSNHVIIVNTVDEDAVISVSANLA